ncbi:uncharacterized protein LOC111044483 isoform X2 [Nilaparvata lugens]|uniref:uncharacterized protein LOC111044483 isoform X2 n=1 Tax=Nilaparvata lugens TaxID=108931 RepID=UPI00193DBC37|nr:uncharacterized protein LOC111044483 isoform X2 [Nilaparvata lugens]
MIHEEINGREQVLDNTTGEHDMTLNIAGEGTLEDKPVFENAESNSETISTESSHVNVAKETSLFLPSNAVAFRYTKNDFSPCTNSTLQLSYEVYELYIKSTHYFILIAFRGAQLVVKTIRCFLNNPDDYGDECVSEIINSAQLVYIYASPMILEVLDLSRLLISLFQAVKHDCFLI